MHLLVNKVYFMFQSLLILNELFPAVQVARKAVEMNPQWWVAHQTLGRAQLNLGEVQLVSCGMQCSDFL